MTIIIESKLTASATDDRPEARAERLKWLRKLANLSIKTIEEKYAINANTYKGWEVARHGGLTEKGAKKVIDLLRQEGVECSLAWILSGIGNIPRLVRLPSALTGTEETRNVSTDDENEMEFIQQELACFRSHYANTIDLVVPDDAMAPCYLPGDIVAGIQHYANSEPNIQSLVGRDCIVQTNTGEILIRQLRTGDSPDRYILISTNPQTTVKQPVLYDVTLYSAAPIIWLRRKR